MENNLIALLNETQNMMNETTISQNPLVSIEDALKRRTNTKQLENESLLDYVVRLKQNRSVMKINLGKGVVEYFVEKSEP